MQSPTAIQAKGDDYSRNPVGTGPFVIKSWTAGDRMVLERNPDYWNKGHPYLDRVVLRPLPDSQSRFASLLSSETDVVWADEFEADNIQRAHKNPALKVHDYVGSGAQVYAFELARCQANEAVCPQRASKGLTEADIDLDRRVTAALVQRGCEIEPQRAECRVVAQA